MVSAGTSESEEDFQTRPIPWHDHPATALDYRFIPVATSDPRFHEPLVDLAGYGIAGEVYYARTDGLNAPYYRSFPSAPSRVWCRKTVAEHLVAVNDSLAAHGVELFVLDGFRPISVQRELWSYFVEEARKRLDQPSEEECTTFAGTYCSDPRDYDETDSQKWTVHITGGAVDVTLRLIGSGEPLFMGGIFDDPSDTSHTAIFERKLNGHGAEKQPLSVSETAALQNRRLLYWAMSDAGFVNYPFEWWHFDLGTQLWVLDGGFEKPDGDHKTEAWYGPAALTD